ncbi:MAG: replicative DNA helicase [Bacilli bacterium]|nr:replicative DNA helicase [Bacilli bacterium]
MAIALDKLPRNIEAEKATLGAMLSSRAVKDQALADLSIDDFFLKIHQRIFEAVFNLNDKNIKVDIQTVAQELKNLKSLDEVGGVDYLYELTQSMLDEENAQEYIGIVKDNANLRNLLLTIGEIENEYLKKDIDSYSAFVGDAQGKIDKIAEERRISNFKSSREVVKNVEKKILDLSEVKKEGDLIGVDTGFKWLNHYTNGLQPENLIILAGRTGLGKTAFALNLLLNAAKSGVPVAIFEMEMSSLTLYSRLVANEADVKGRRIMTGGIRGREVIRVKEALDRLAALKIYVDESSAVSIYDLVAKARKLKTEQPDLGLIVIDYLGLISNDNKRNKRRYDNRQLEIQEYTRTLHELARDLKVPIVVLCQLNRKVEERGEGGTPRLSDLRESGSIEQDAEIVLLMHSPDYGKNELTEEAKRLKAGKTTAANMSPEARSALVDKATVRTFQENKGEQANQEDSVVMNVIIAKNRNGESGKVVKLLFEKDYSRFTELSDDFAQQEKAIQARYADDEDE